MLRMGIAGLAAALACSAAMPAVAADIPEPPPVVEAPVYVAPEVGGWYIRGDVDYHWPQWDNAHYILYGTPGSGNGDFDDGELKGAMSLGAGIGYQINDYFRVDLTGDYFFNSDFEGSTSGICVSTGLPCTSSDSSSYQAFLMLANAYVDLGTYSGFTPYVGGGIGGAYVEWDNLTNVSDDGEFEHEGKSNWRFAYALMTGVSYCLTEQTKLDVGYRYSHINGGKMFGYADGVGPGYDHGIDTHEVRAGLRYQFGGPSNCALPVVAVAPEPIYKQ